METIKTIQSFFLVLMIGTLLGCTKNGTTYDVISTTPPELHVVVVSDDNNTVKVGGATVTLYKSQEDLDSDTNAYLTKQTGENGEAAFTKDELKNGGFYYAKAMKDVLTGSKQSQYLLLNDGINYLYVKIQ